MRFFCWGEGKGRGGSSIGGSGVSEMVVGDGLERRRGGILLGWLCVLWDVFR